MACSVLRWTTMKSPFSEHLRVDVANATECYGAPYLKVQPRPVIEQFECISCENSGGRRTKSRWQPRRFVCSVVNERAAKPRLEVCCQIWIFDDIRRRRSHFLPSRRRAAADADRRAAVVMIDGFAARADRAEQATAAERVRADALRDRIEAMRADLDQAQRDAQAAQDDARRARGVLARLRDAWRGE
jgi:hypothetical protein